MEPLLIENALTEIEIKRNNLSSELQNFIDVYQGLHTNNIEELRDVYATYVEFIDPMHQVHGLDNLIEYFQRLYCNLQSCTFTVYDAFEQGNCAAIYWQMEYVHPKLNSSKPVIVHGHSRLKLAKQQIIYHRDYLDLGAMLYEQIPVVGRLIKVIKQRASQ